ncbi:MAG: Rv0361 family membrane protein [Acidimicrobiia bacterium]
MGDPGNPTNPDTGADAEPDPDQPGWASPTPPPPSSAPPPATEPVPSSVPPPPSQAPTWGSAPQWGAPQPAWGAPPPGGPPPGMPPPGMPPPAGPGGGWAPQGPVVAPKKRRLTWLWFLIPILVVFLAAATVAIVFGVKLFTGPVDATNDYYAELKVGNYARAYTHLCSDLQVRYTVSEFDQLQRNDARTLGRIRAYKFDTSNFENGDVFVRGTVIRSPFNQHRIEVRLVREDSDWKVCSVRNL